MSQDKYELATENARWIIEKYWQANEGMMKRSSVLVGLLGIELGVVGSLESKNFTENPHFYFALIGAAASIVLSIGFLLWTVIDKEFDFPTIENLNAVHHVDDSEIKKSILDFTLQIKYPKYGLYQNLAQENEEIAFRFRLGAILAVLGQGLLLLAFLINWIEKIN